MENNKLLYAIFTIGIVILVLLVVQMFIMIPAVMHGGQPHPYPMMSAAPMHQKAPAQCLRPAKQGVLPKVHNGPAQPGFRDGQKPAEPQQAK